jgi:hypothetical protein
MPFSQSRRLYLLGGVGAVGTWTLTGCGGGMSSATPANSGAGTSAATLANGGAGLLGITSTTLTKLRDRPETFLDAYSAFGGAAAVRSKLGAPFSSLTDAGSMVTYASALVFESAAVGACAYAPYTATVTQLLHSPAMACGHMCKLATYLSFLGHPELIPPDAAAGMPAKPTIHFVVWLVNVPLNTGIHSQLILSNVLDDAYLLLDPLYAYALRIPFGGRGPDPAKTVIENAATMMQVPIAAENLVILDPRGTADSPQIPQVVTSGVMGPQYIQHDSLYGSESWDTVIGRVFNDMGGPLLPFPPP